MVTSYYNIDQPLLTLIAIFELIWITNTRIDGSIKFGKKQNIGKSEKLLYQLFKLVSFYKSHISSDWYIKKNLYVADIRVDIMYTLSDSFGPIYDGFRIPWQIPLKYLSICHQINTVIYTLAHRSNLNLF